MWIVHHKIQEYFRVAKFYDLLFLVKDKIVKFKTGILISVPLINTMQAKDQSLQNFCLKDLKLIFPPFFHF